ncbi:MAG: T9SS type A sorting domain-containing protein, partial [Candidatus Krumholzibacteriota bacterium]|nr:T9SS type A sorting domain-containing protein [Candidatus Krumholzibacteriota bacterium]
SIPANALPGKYELLGSVRNRDDWDDVYEVTGCEINSGWDCQDMWISCLGVGDGIRTYKAVITGTDNHSRPYQFELITDDIDNLAATILESGPSHWFVENMFLVYPPMATQSAIEGAINNAAAGMDADDILMFQHTGHGNDSSDDYGGLFLQNSDYFSRAELYNFLDTNLPYGATCILAINVCNSGGWIEWLNTFDAHRITYYVLSSSEADEATSVTTWELGMDSTPFGYCLRKALAGYSDDNSDLDVDFNEIHSYVFDYMSNLPPYLLLIYKASHPMIYPSTASDYPVLIHQYGNMDILPWIEIQQPDADIQVVAGTDITISWYDNDSDDDATVNLYWGGTTIISGLTDSNGSLCTHDWETDGVSPGAYYIMGEIVDGEHEPCYSSSPGLVTILPPEPPVVITVSDSPDPLTRPEMLILSANVNAGTSAVNAVQFWRENNEIEGLQVTEVTDLFLGEDLSADGGWSLEIPTSNLSAGDYQYYAYAIDVNAQGSVVGSSALSTMNTIQNIPPQFESLSISDGSLEGGQEFTLIAHDLTDSDGQIVLAEFYFDIDKNSIFDPEQDTKLGDDENGADGWSWTGSLIDQPPGMLRFFAWIKDNDNGWSTPKSISANSTVVDVENTPLIFALGQNVPNPFNPSTTINFNLPYPAHVRIDVFSVDGKHVSTLLNRSKGAGHHVVQWLGQNDNGTPMASGVYFYRIQAGSYTETKRMVLVR